MKFEFAISLLAVAGFGLALWWIQIARVAREALNTAIAGLSSMMDSELDDYAKEEAVRSAGFALIVVSFGIFWRFLIALAVASAPIFLADGLGLVSRDDVFGLMLRLDYIIFVSVVAIVVIEIYRRIHSVSEVSSLKNNWYTKTDHFFHILAFSNPAVLKAASFIEDRLLSKVTQEPFAPPIFITSLARGGTTALLNALHDIPGITTHIYRDMPFLTAPNLWNRLSGGMKRNVERHQRAHGDGLVIDLDSPEAFEEVIWKMFWPKKYQKTSIALWRGEDRNADAEQFLKRHMAKVIQTRLTQKNDSTNISGAARYCSKNNTNIARIPYLVEAFPGCQIIVPVRRPECHAASLLRQHQNFLKLHSEDYFIKRYMRDIGHFEFGLIHKPIQFPGLDANMYDPNTGDYWLNYWIHAFQEILDQRDSCIFILQDNLRSSPQATMENLCSVLEFTPGTIQFNAYFHSSPDSSQNNLYNQALYEKAVELYHEFEKYQLQV
jgi:hypothetical protein